MRCPANSGLNNPDRKEATIITGRQIDTNQGKEKESSFKREKKVETAKIHC